MSTTSGWLKINDSGGLTDHTSQIDNSAGGITFDLQLGQRATAVIPLVMAASDSYSPVVGSPVYVYDIIAINASPVTTRCVFAGTIDSIDRRWDGNDGTRRVTLNCVSLEQCFDVLVIDPNEPGYEGVLVGPPGPPNRQSDPTPPGGTPYRRSYFGQTVDYIFRDVFNGVCTGVPVTLGLVEAGPVIDSYTSNFERVSECFDALAKFAGYVWGVDPSNQTLYFRAPTVTPSPYALASEDILWETASVSTSRADKRNRQGIRLNYEAFVPSYCVARSSGGVYTVPYPVAQVTDAFTSTATQAYVDVIFSAQPAAGDTITLGDATYTFVATLDNTQTRQVKIMSSVAATRAALADAVNNNYEPSPEGPGRNFSLATWEHDRLNYIADYDSGANKVTRLVARYPGTVGNGCAVSTTSAAITFSATETGNGVDGPKTQLSVGLHSSGQSQDVYWTYGSNEIEVTVSVTGNLYIGYYRVGGDIIQVEDTTDVTARAAIEHGTGKMQQVTSDSEQTDPTTALQIAQQILDRYIALPDRFDFQTDLAGFLPGQRLISRLNENKPPGLGAMVNPTIWLVQEVAAETVVGVEYLRSGGGHFRYTVRCVSAPIGTDLEFWTGLASGGSGGGATIGGISNAPAGSSTTLIPVWLEGVLQGAEAALNITNANSSPSGFGIVCSAALYPGSVTLIPAFAATNNHYVLSGPASGGPLTPTFRALVASDIPIIDIATQTTSTLSIARGGTGQTTAATAFAALISGSTVQIANGGTGQTTAALAFSALISGSTVAVANGGTGSTTAGGARTNLGIGTAGTRADSYFLQASNNLSDLTSSSTAQSNLGLGSAATHAATDFLLAADGLTTSQIVVTAIYDSGGLITGYDTVYLHFGSGQLTSIT